MFVTNLEKITPEDVKNLLDSVSDYCAPQIRNESSLRFITSQLLDSARKAIGTQYQFSVPGITAEQLEVEVSHNDYTGISSLHVKVLKGSCFCPHRSNVTLYPPKNLDLSTAETHLENGILTVNFKYKAKDEKKNFKIPVV